MPATRSDKLERYRAKRSADRTPEPFGADGSRSVHTAARSFVVQHHAARQLHYDFRLEMDGVLRSWAVPKGPSANPADKRFAAQVEDHPLEYANFEGRIPEGNYGAGAVIVWDRGVWIPIGDPAEGLKSGKLLFELRGYKLRGKWTLVKTKRGDKDWLLIKERDSYVSESGTEAFASDSILSGLTIAALASRENRETGLVRRLEGSAAVKQRLRPGKVKVMLATSGAAFNQPGWLFEIKYDGYRLVASREGGEARLYSRNQHDLTAVFPEIAEVVEALPFDGLVMDGEAVVHDERGIPSFSRLQKRGKLSRRIDIARAAVESPATLYVFDLLGLGEFDLRPLPLETRKSMLKEVLPSVGPVRFSDHIEEHGERMYQRMGELGLEGIVAKKSNSRYRAGRSADWVKVAVEHADDFVVVGYTDAGNSRLSIGALLLAQFGDGKLIYAGRVGTGFSRAELKVVGERLRRAGAASPPSGAPQTDAFHWVQPQLVCTVKYKETTPDGLLRQPVFLGLRQDKEIEECLVRGRLQEPLPETPKPDSTTPSRGVSVTNAGKIFWPQDGYSKGELIRYYRDIAPWLLRYLADRPVVLTRYPDGIEGKSFFQKDAPEFAPDWIRMERMWSEGAERDISYFVVENTEALVYVANMASIPLHIWSSRIQSLDRPDWCILDLDPKQAPFAHVVRIANAIRELCTSIELPCFVKSSGSTGLHVLIPLGHQYSYEQSRSLGEVLARVVVAELPELATIARSVASRRGRVYIDYLQNGHGRLLVSAFSARPLPGAPVSMPLRWHEVNGRLNIKRFTIKNALRRMRALKVDPMSDVLELAPSLPDALERLSTYLK